MWMNWRHLNLLLILTAGIPLSGQVESMKVVDASDGKPVPYCHICIEHLDSDEKAYFVSNLEGMASVLLHGHEIISVSAIGYQSYFDTLTSIGSVMIVKLEQDLFNLGEVVVTGHGKPVSRDQSIYNIEFISKNQIEYQAANTLADILDNQLNISINNDPSTGSSLSLQGISGENVKIMIDGVPVIGRLDGNIDLSQINLENVDHIEIVEGPMSVMYGSNALAGVVNIITKENKHAKIKGGVHGYYETVGIYNLNANSSFRKGKSEFALNAGRNFFDGHALEKGSRSMQWKPKEQYNVGINYTFGGEKIKIRYKTDYFQEKLLDRNDPYPYPYFEKGNDTWFRTMRYNNNIQFDKAFSDRTNANLLLGYSYYDRKKEIYVKDLTTFDTLSIGGFDTTKFHGFIARGILNHEMANEKWNFYAGFDINTETGLGKRIMNGKEYIGDYAVFGSIQYKPVEQLVLQPGLRVSYNTKYNSPIIPSFNIKYSLGSGSLRASYARGFRAPSLKELYLHFYDANHQIEGNADLIAERSHNINLNFSCHPKIGDSSFDLKVKTFYNIIEDRISLVKVDPDNPLHYKNANTGHFESLGGDMSAGFNPWDRISFFAGIGTIGRKDSYYESEKFVFSPMAVSNLSARFIQNKLIASIFYKYSGKYPDYSFNENDDIVLEYLHDYHNMDFTVSARLFKQAINLTTGVKNIFNNSELTGVSSGGNGHGTEGGASSLVGWGRTFFVSLKYNFVKY